MSPGSPPPPILSGAAFAGSCINMASQPSPTCFTAPPTTSSGSGTLLCATSICNGTSLTQRCSTSPAALSGPAGLWAANTTTCVMLWTSGPWETKNEGRKTKAQFLRLSSPEAIIWEGEDGEVRSLTYAQLYREVNKAANALKSLGIGRGDRVG